MQYPGLAQWTSRKRKEKPKDKSHINATLTQHALNRASKRNVSVREIVEGRACVQQITDKEGRFITIIPIQKK